MDDKNEFILVSQSIAFQDTFRWYYGGKYILHKLHTYSLCHDGGSSSFMSLSNKLSRGIETSQVYKYT